MSDNLRHLVLTFPAIDNHAHPLLVDDSTIDFTGAISEARGDALPAAHTSLAAMRAARQLGPLYGLEEVNPDWEALLEARRSKAHEKADIRDACFQAARIQCLLLDDGLPGECESIPFHDQYAISPSKRIVRIENVAEELLRQLFDTALAGGSASPFSVPHILQSFTSKLGPDLAALAASPDVAGFKSVVCYRTGLAVAPEHEIRKLEISLGMLTNRYWTSLARGERQIRLQDKSLNDFVVRTAMTVAASTGKPIQFHTGLGDNDLLLSLASPSHLQPLIRAYPSAPIVLLHGSYPFTREAGYLAATHANVYLDIGEVWPFISASGQREVVREALELCPTSKILWSTDGHFWPETYYLGALQGRQALAEVLIETVSRNELSEAQAVQVAKRILFENSNKVYSLGLVPKWPISHRRTSISESMMEEDEEDEDEEGSDPM